MKRLRSSKAIIPEDATTAERDASDKRGPLGSGGGSSRAPLKPWLGPGSTSRNIVARSHALLSSQVVLDPGRPRRKPRGNLIPCRGIRFPIGEIARGIFVSFLAHQ